MKVSTFRVAHSSGQFTDKPEQQRADARRIVARVHDRQILWCTGTEAGSRSELNEAFHLLDREHGLSFSKAPHADVWILHRRDLFQGSTEHQWYQVIHGEGGDHPYGPRGIYRITGYAPLAGADITLTVGHLLTGGSPVGPHDKDRLHKNDQIMQRLSEIGDEFGHGANLVFYGGDQNIPEHEGLMLGAPFTSLATELDKVQRTGGAAIDCISSYNQDRRISGVDFDVLDDSEFRLATDHFFCEGVFEIKHRELRHG